MHPPLWRIALHCASHKLALAPTERQEFFGRNFRPMMMCGSVARPALRDRLHGKHVPDQAFAVIAEVAASMRSRHLSASTESTSADPYALRKAASCFTTAPRTSW